MVDLPILFSAPMVCGLLREIEAPGTGKTQTRRYLTPWSEYPPALVQGGAITALDERDRPYSWPRTYAVGDRLYVKEAWRTPTSHNGDAKALAHDAAEAGHTRPWAPIQYEADGARENWEWADYTPGRYRHARFMPRWASRITLTVTDLRVQRLQGISGADALTEGICADPSITEAHNHWIDLGGGDMITGWDAREVYASLWNSLHGPGAWAANPWVTAYKFSVERGNIDQQGAR